MLPQPDGVLDVAKAGAISCIVSKLAIASQTTWNYDPFGGLGRVSNPVNDHNLMMRGYCRISREFAEKEEAQRGKLQSRLLQISLLQYLPELRYILLEGMWGSTLATVTV